MALAFLSAQRSKDPNKQVGGEGGKGGTEYIQYCTSQCTVL